jgi:hypothetical protein
MESLEGAGLDGGVRGLNLEPAGVGGLCLTGYYRRQQSDEYDSQCFHFYVPR